MKVYILFSLFLRVLSKGILFDEDRSEQILSTALENVTRHLFLLETRMFINNYGIDSDTITTIVLQKLNENAMPFQLKNLKLDKEKVLLDSSTLLTFKEFSFVRDFNQKLQLTNEYFKPLQLFVYCQNVTITDIKSLALDVTKRVKGNKATYYNTQFIVYGIVIKFHFKPSQFDIIQYEYFLVEETNFVKLLTFVWYSPGKCGELELIELNSFDKITKNWENAEFSMKKSTNLHKCEIISVPLQHDLISLVDLNIYQEFQDFMNATFVPRIAPLTAKEKRDREITDLDLIFSKGCLNAVDRYTFVNNNHKSGSVSGLNFITTPFDFSVSRVFADYPDKYYSEYDKLWMPFDDFTWALIALFFVAAFTTILILLCCVRRSTRDFIIGPNVTTPSLNVIQIFFGISQAVVPRRNFARFLTMMFILYCLIIRTAWQGKTFEFMQKDIEKPTFGTIGEMIDLGYTFIMEEDFKEKFPESEISKRGKVTSPTIVYSSAANVKKYNSMLISFQMTASMFKLELLERKKKQAKRFKKPDLPVIMCGLQFPRHHPFFELFDLKLQQLVTSGILGREILNEYCVSSQWSSINLNRYKTIEESKALNLKMLEPGFVIWTTSLLLAVAAFIFEWLKTLMDLIFVKYVLQAFYKTRHQNGQFHRPNKEIKIIEAITITEHVAVDLMFVEDL